MRDIIAGGLLLPLRIYFQPDRFADAIANLAPNLPHFYRLWEARRQLRDAAFRRGLGRILLQAIISLSWCPIFLLLFAAFGFDIDWRSAAIGVVVGVSGVVAGSVARSLMGIVAFGVVLGVAGGLPASVAVSVAPSVRRGVVVGVVLGAMFGLAQNGGGLVAFTVRLHMAFSVVFGVAVGVAYGVTDGLACSVALSITSILIVTHAPLLVVQFIISIVSWVIVRFWPTSSPAMWRISPARWDEVILLPLPGLVGLLVTLIRFDPWLGWAALNKVTRHLYQWRATPRVLVQLAQEDAMEVASPVSLAAFGRTLNWLPDETLLAAPAETLLLVMRDISREVGSALESDSATNRVRRLEAAADMLESLRMQPGKFRAALARWSEIIQAELEEARRRQREEEPIPQVYMSDGRPIRPADRPDTALPFKGRTTLFRQLETALGGGETDRATFLLYGQRRTGKTSALMQLPRRLGSQMVPAFLDLQSEKLGGAQDIVGLLSGLANEVVEEARRHRQARLPALDRTALASDPYPALGRWLDQVENALGNRTLLLCLDEFEELEQGIEGGRFDIRLLVTLRNIVQHRRRVAVLLSGSHQINELKPHWASALITTTTLPISFLEEADTRELIQEPVTGFPAIYTSAAVDRIVQVTHCQPYLVQLTCALLVERMNAARRMPPESFVTIDDVGAVIPLVLERGQNYFIDLWNTQTGGDLARRILEEIARSREGCLSRTAVRQIESDETALREAIARLLRREIIEHTDDSYRITVPLVAEYVRRAMLL